jgi:2',3'-cyclic-nucleotide 2'-phosphodiesterase (5'-nucleotidase family)
VRRFAAHTVFPLVMLAALTACAPQPAAPAGAQTGPFELTVVHSNDTWGYLDPCG